MDRNLREQRREREKSGMGRHGLRHHGAEDHGTNRHSREQHNGSRNRKGYRLLVEKPGTHLLFIGSRSCTRHKGTMKMELQQEGKLTFLILDDVDWITGSYLNEIEEAVRLVVSEIHPEKLILFGGCQIELLSADYATLTKNLSEELKTNIYFHKGCHFVGYDPYATE